MSISKANKLQWYLLGLSFGVPKDYLEELKGYPEKECLIEVLKYWLRNHRGQPTWQEIDEVQEKVKTYMQTINTKTGTITQWEGGERT